MSIKLNFHPGTSVPVGCSKWWGAPDLPADSPYPIVPCTDEDDAWDEPLTFLCQIRCEDIAHLDPEGLLPHQGMLYFFAAIDYFLGLDCPIETHIGDWDLPCVRVMYSPSCDNLEPYEMHYDDGSDVYFPAERLTFEACGERDDCFKLLGRPYLEEICEEHPDCLSLLQVDGNDDWQLNFYDCGMLCLLATRQQLLDRDWHSVHGYLHSF